MTGATARMTVAASRIVAADAGALAPVCAHVLAGPPAAGLLLALVRRRRHMEGSNP